MAGISWDLVLTNSIINVKMWSFGNNNRVKCTKTLGCSKGVSPSDVGNSLDYAGERDSKDLSGEKQVNRCVKLA